MRSRKIGFVGHTKVLMSNSFSTELQDLYNKVYNGEWSYIFKIKNAIYADKWYHGLDHGMIQEMGTSEHIRIVDVTLSNGDNVLCAEEQEFATTVGSYKKVKDMVGEYVVQPRYGEKIEEYKIIHVDDNVKLSTLTDVFTISTRGNDNYFIETRSGLKVLVR